METIAVLAVIFLVLVAFCIMRNDKGKGDAEKTDENGDTQTQDRSEQALPRTQSEIKEKMCTTTPIVTVEVTSERRIVNYSRYLQRFDENYDKNLGYEWFRICVEMRDYPIYNTFNRRLLNVRKNSYITQADAAKYLRISPSTLSSYENALSYPTIDRLHEIAEIYHVPFSFLKYGYVDDLQEQVKLASRYGEEEYIQSLTISVRAASKIFPEMLTDEDKAICVFVNDYFKMNLDLFNEKAKEKEAEAKAKEELLIKIHDDIITKLHSGPLLQSKLVNEYPQNAYDVRKIITDLVNNGFVTKEKSGSSYLISLCDQSDANND